MLGSSAKHKEESLYQEHICTKHYGLDQLHWKKIRKKLKVNNDIDAYCSMVQLSNYYSLWCLPL